MDSDDDEFCENGEPIVGYDTKNKRFVSNSCIFNGGIFGKQMQGVEHEEQETDSDDIQIVENKQF